MDFIKMQEKLTESANNVVNAILAPYTDVKTSAVCTDLNINFSEQSMKLNFKIPSALKPATFASISTTLPIAYVEEDATLIKEVARIAVTDILEYTEPKNTKVVLEAQKLLQDKYSLDFVLRDFFSVDLLIKDAASKQDPSVLYAATGGIHSDLYSIVKDSYEKAIRA